MPVHECHVYAGAKELECRLRRRVLSAHDDDALLIEGMGVVVVVIDVRQVLAGNAQAVRQVVVANRQHHGARMTDPPAVAAGHMRPAPGSVAGRVGRVTTAKVPSGSGSMLNTSSCTDICSWQVSTTRR